MIPTPAFLAILFVSILVASIVNFALGQYIERKRREGRLNVFDAYSDSELDRERRNTAKKVMQFHGSRLYQVQFQNNLRYLKDVDLEIARRDKEKERQKVLEQSNISQTMLELAKFDTVFTALESGQKEKK